MSDYSNKEKNFVEKRKAQNKKIIDRLKQKFRPLQEHKEQMFPYIPKSGSVHVGSTQQHFISKRNSIYGIHLNAPELLTFDEQHPVVKKANQFIWELRRQPRNSEKPAWKSIQPCSTTPRRQKTKRPLKQISRSNFSTIDSPTFQPKWSRMKTNKDNSSFRSSSQGCSTPRSGRSQTIRKLYPCTDDDKQLFVGAKFYINYSGFSLHSFNSLVLLLFHLWEIDCGLDVHFVQTSSQPFLVFGAEHFQPLFVDLRFFVKSVHFILGQVALYGHYLFHQAGILLVDGLGLPF